MEAIRYFGRRDLRLDTVPEPEPGRGQVLLRVEACVLAQVLVDLNMAGHFVDTGQPHPRTGLGEGFILGQQFCGVVAAVGPGVSEERIGQRVGVAPGVGCGGCQACKAGQVNHCDALAYYGLVGAHGGLASLCVVEAECAVPVPSMPAGVLLEALLVVHNLYTKAEAFMVAGEPVLILGAGPVGLCAATLLRDLYGRAPVLYDVLPGRLRRAEEWGFDVAAEAELRRFYPVVMDCAGTNPDTGGSAMLDGLGRVAKGGAIAVCGTYLHQTTLSPADFLFREVAWLSSFAYAQRDLDRLVPRLGELELGFVDHAVRMDLATAASEGLLRGEVDRDGFTLMLVTP